MGMGEGSARGRQPGGFPVGRIPAKPAGLWVRVAAFLVDAALLFTILCMGLLVLLLTSLGEAFRNTTDPALLLSPPLLVSAGLGLLAAFLYFPLGESSPDQGTMGKRIFELRVVDQEGRRIAPARAAGRFLVKIISFAALLAGVVMIGMTQRKQGLHDLAADTLVLEPLVTDTRLRMGMGLAAVAISLTAFLAVLALAITFVWSSMR